MFWNRIAPGIGAAACVAVSTSIGSPAWGDEGTHRAIPRVVVAIIDSGINVYHDFYYEGGEPYPAGSPPSAVTPAVLAELDVGPECRFALTRTGDFAADFKTDTDLNAPDPDPFLYCQ